MKFLSIYLVLFLNSMIFSTEQVLDDIVLAFKQSNTKEISKLFESSVEFKMLQKSSIYSAKQAEMVLKDFFEKNPPTNFKIIHKGASTKGAKYIIGLYESPRGNYKVYVYLQDSQDRTKILEVNIESE